MNKKDLINDMRRATGASFITRKELAQFMNLKDPAGADRYTHGLPRLSGRYFIADIAERLMDQVDFRR